MIRIELQRCWKGATLSLARMICSTNNQRQLYVMLNSLRMQPVVADQARRASASGWSTVSWTRCDLKPVSKEVQSQT